MTTDLAAAARDAHDRLTRDVPRLAGWLRACYEHLYHDHRRRSPTDPDAPPQPGERTRRCGACEHPADDHDDRGCALDECRCTHLEDWPSTVGWAQWTAAGQAEKAYVAAAKHLQRANDAVGRIDTVPAHWASGVLERPGNRTVPMHVDLALHGTRLLTAALRHVDPHALAPPEASALMEAADEVAAGIERLVKAQEPLEEHERNDLRKRRCSVWVSGSRQCQEEHHADGKCRSHYNAAYYRRSRAS